MAQTDLELLTQCADFTLRHTSPAELELFEDLENTSTTRLRMSVRLFNLQRTVLAIGMFSLFEGLLQSKLGWEKPFEHLTHYLRFHEKPELATTFNEYKLGINVLKHGAGRSHDELVARASSLEFKVRESVDYWVDTLVLVDDAFVRRCAALIEELRTLIAAIEQIWL